MSDKVSVAGLVTQSIFNHLDLTSVVVSLNLAYGDMWDSWNFFLFFVLFCVQQTGSYSMGSLRVEEPVHTSWSRFCSVNHQVTTNFPT